MGEKYRKNQIIWRTSIIGVLVLLIIMSFLQIVANKTVESVSAIKIDEKTFSVELAVTKDERELGLSGRNYLENDRGMLFIFDKPDIQRFWMKDMNFSIDIIWISSDFEVVGIERSASPETFPEIFSSPEPVSFVLEVNSGKASDIKIGDEVIFLKTL